MVNAVTVKNIHLVVLLLFCLVPACSCGRMPGIFSIHPTGYDKEPTLPASLLPVLKRPASDDFVVYHSGGLFIWTSYYFSDSDVDITLDSIVYHWANGITEVFESSGERFLIARDAEVPAFLTPEGSISSSGNYVLMTDEGGARYVHAVTLEKQVKTNKIIRVYGIVVVFDPSDYHKP
jgi:hypothetical protein